MKFNIHGAPFQFPDFIVSFFCFLKKRSRLGPNFWVGLIMPICQSIVCNLKIAKEWRGWSKAGWVYSNIASNMLTVYECKS